MAEQRGVRELPPSKVLHELFVEREPGVLFNRVDRGLRPAGALSGFFDQVAHWKIKINRHDFVRGRLIWKMHTGNDPLGFIDHLNLDTLDDRFENLRDVVRGESNRGRRDGGLIVHYDETCSKSLCITQSLRFTLGIWPDENLAAIQAALDQAIQPIVERIYANRRGRARPLSPRVKLPAANGNSEPRCRRF
jgi:hypothetical protein